MSDNKSNTEDLHECGAINKDDLSAEHTQAIESLSKDAKSIGSLTLADNFLHLSYIDLAESISDNFIVFTQYFLCL